MGRKVKKITLSTQACEELEEHYRSNSGVFSRRCHMILLKNQELSSKAIGQILGVNENTVNSWAKRYESLGIKGLETKSGQGRKPILNQEKDSEIIKKKVQEERQRLKLIKNKLESELDKKFSMKTLTRFLKTISADGNESG